MNTQNAGCCQDSIHTWARHTRHAREWLCSSALLTSSRLGLLAPVVLGTDDYRQIAPLVLTRSFARFVQRLGLKNLTFHDLRHDVASTLAMEGVPLWTIAEI